MYASENQRWTKADILQGTARFYRRRPVPKLSADVTREVSRLPDGTIVQVWDNDYYAAHRPDGTRLFLSRSEVEGTPIPEGHTTMIDTTTDPTDPPTVGSKIAIEALTSEGGITMRWGTLHAVTVTHLIVDDYHDSAGIGAYLPGRGCNVHDGVPVSLADIHKVYRPDGTRLFLSRSEVEGTLDSHDSSWQPYSLSGRTLFPN